MKIGTVKGFNLRKGYGFIHPDDGGPNIFVHMSAVEIAGMNDLKEGQRVIFEIQRDERTGNASAVSLKAVVFATTQHLDGRFATTNPFDIIAAFISSTMSAVSATSRLKPPDQENPYRPNTSSASFGRDLTSGWHYGQWLCVPRKQVGHMAAPTSVAEALKNPRQRGAVHTGSI
jgi:cold shock protein